MNKFIYLGSEWAEAMRSSIYWRFHIIPPLLLGYSTFLFSPFSP